MEDENRLDIMKKAIEIEQEIRINHLEMLAAAFLKQTDLSPTECELVQERKGLETIWYFRKRIMLKIDL